MDAFGRTGFFLRHLLVFCALVLRSSYLAAQTAPMVCQPPNQPAPTNSDDSVAAAARKNKSEKSTHSKKVFTDEDMEAWSGPLPRLRMDGTENSEEVIAAILAYRKTHTAKETESAVRVWFERYDEMLVAAIHNSTETRNLRAANTSNGYELCMESQDYGHCHNRQMAEQRGARHDQVQMADDFNVESRIQQAFMRIRNALCEQSPLRLVLRSEPQTESTASKPFESQVIPTRHSR
jgi:hypothetical protein